MTQKTAIFFTYTNRERKILGTISGEMSDLANIKAKNLPLKEPSKYENIYIVIDGIEYKINF
ncbi:hypothetical protein [Staphylococcus auricularis]|uniref:hypothetical protein n=1 Tax=Staphylococcus auricularis TaxID=29379 RepID=UPI002430BA1B|nr:hypothetical protein [Staphylococcus auricularis]